LEKTQSKHETLGCIIKEKCKDNLTDYIRQHGTTIEFPTSDSWVILSPIEQTIKKKIEKIGMPLKDWDISINYGIKTGCNEAFIINKIKRDELIAKDSKSAELIRPILRGRDIERYKSNFADLYIINAHNGIPDKKIPPIDIKNFPAVKEHLDKYWEKIKDRDDHGVTPYNLRSCAYMHEFSKQKIIYPNMTKYMPFFLDNEGYYTNQKCFIITGEKLAYLTAFFNSNIFKICYRNSFPELQGGTRELSKVFFKEVKIPYIKNLISDDFEILVADAQKGKDYADLRVYTALLLALDLQRYSECIMNYKI
jgi:hypothetical protein